VHRLAELERRQVEDLAADLVSREAVQLAATRRGERLRELLLQLPDQLAPVLASETSPARVAAILDAEYRRILLELGRPDDRTRLG